MIQWIFVVFISTILVECFLCNLNKREKKLSSDFLLKSLEMPQDLLLSVKEMVLISSFNFFYLPSVALDLHKRMSYWLILLCWAVILQVTRSFLFFGGGELWRAYRTLEYFLGVFFSAKNICEYSLWKWNFLNVEKKK